MTKLQLQIERNLPPLSLFTSVLIWKTRLISKVKFRKSTKVLRARRILRGIELRDCLDSGGAYFAYLTTYI